MSDIAEAFDRMKSRGEKGFIPFITAGDPDLQTTFDLMVTLAEHGATIIELGVPFSDPMADGPVIQRSSQRALKKGVSLHGIIELIRGFKKEVYNLPPIVLFSYLNPLWRYGLEKLAVAAFYAELDGVLVTDVIGDEAAAIRSLFARNNVDLISLVAPTTTEERLRDITASASGFIYAISRAGVTGARNEASADAETLVERIKQFTDLPVAVGFGISTRAQIEDVWRYADAAVVGSAIVAEIEKCNGTDVVPSLDRFLRDLLPPKP
jgi:tryptophan synthase alpha chain